MGRRLAALMIDWVVATFTTGLLFPIFASSLAPSLTRLVIFVLEVGLMTALTGASIGQRILGIRVVTYPDQFFLIPSKAFLRTLLIALVIPALLFVSSVPHVPFRIRDYHPLWSAFPDRFAKDRAITNRLLRFRSPLLSESRLMSGVIKFFRLFNLSIIALI